MKTLYIGNYKDRTGWGYASLNNILALHSAGVDVVPRAITFNNSHADIHPTITKLEAKSESDCDACIYHTLPPLYSYNAKIKNIGFFVTETVTFTETMWQKHINMMDEVWVPNQQMVEACHKSGVKAPIKIAPHSLDLTKYSNIEDCADATEFEGCFNFCFVGEMINRKNIEGLLRAFHTEFHPSEPVNLMLKINKSGFSNDATLEAFKNLSDSVKSRLKIRSNYRKEIAIAGHLEDRHLLSLMAKCHCFVMPSFGEAWCIPALESMAVGMPVIYTGNTGMDDFCHGWKVDSEAKNCYNATDSLDYMYTSHTKWMEPNIEHLSSAMRVAYETYKNDRKKYDLICADAQLKAQNYSNANVGVQLKELLYG
jgi:glycosyltransferase involved in cell wall biosynthesis